MSLPVSDVTNEIFDSEVKHEYQAMDNPMRAGCRMRTGVEGKIYKFRVMGKGIALERSAPQADVTIADTTHGLVDCTIKDYDWSDLSDTFAQSKINFLERRELAQVGAYAIRRRADQVAIDALKAATSDHTKIAAGAANLTLDKLLEVKALADQNEWPTSDRFMVIHSSQLNNGLLSDDKITSADYTTLQALSRGTVNSFLGFQFIILGDRDEGGLTEAAGTRTCFAWHKASLGCCEGIAIRGRAEWVAMKKSYLVTTEMSLGAVVIDTNGFVEVDCLDA